MRCANCHRTINPDRAYYDKHRRTFGPVCGSKLGLVELVMPQANTKPRVYKNVPKCPVWASPPDFQDELFEGWVIHA